MIKVLNSSPSFLSKSLKLCLPLEFHSDFLIGPDLTLTWKMTLISQPSIVFAFGA
jgi:hypothetical protein